FAYGVRGLGDVGGSGWLHGPAELRSALFDALSCVGAGLKPAPTFQNLRRGEACLAR
ncbi:MAG: hypothetical protein QOD29_5532, partial [Alphaproteobacteria bacterium]|nr:hypothetical protein [Alphaproteobacteria bacterium]